MLNEAPVTMETNNLTDFTGFDDDFRECSSENCRNNCLTQKTTCMLCTENITLRIEIARLHKINDEMMEHMIDLETNQSGKSKRRKIEDNKTNQQEKDGKECDAIQVLTKQVHNYMEKKIIEMTEIIKDTIAEHVNKRSSLSYLILN